MNSITVFPQNQSKELYGTFSFGNPMNKTGAYVKVPITMDDAEYIQNDMNRRFFFKKVEGFIFSNNARLSVISPLFAIAVEKKNPFVINNLFNLITVQVFEQVFRENKSIKEAVEEQTFFVARKYFSSMSKESLIKELGVSEEEFEVAIATFGNTFNPEATAVANFRNAFRKIGG